MANEITTPTDCEPESESLVIVSRAKAGARTRDRFRRGGRWTSVMESATFFKTQAAADAALVGLTSPDAFHDAPVVNVLILD